MNHGSSPSLYEKYRRDGGIHQLQKLLAFLLAFALLVGDTAAGLASGLAGSLAFAAAAVLGAFAQVPGFDGLNMFHGMASLICFNLYYHFPQRMSIHPRQNPPCLQIAILLSPLAVVPAFFSMEKYAIIQAEKNLSFPYIRYRRNEYERAMAPG